MVKHFSRAEAAKILDTSVGRLRYWDSIGLARPSLREGGRAYYDFQDLICLKTAQGMIDKGVSTAKAQACVATLRKRLPLFDGQLNCKRIYVFGTRIIISHKNRLIDSHSGQLQLKFDIDDFEAEVRNRIGEKETPKTAEEWFQDGMRLQGRPGQEEEALRHFRKAVRLDPNLADAYVAMGVVHHREKRHIDAQRCFRLAIRTTPYHARACFHLAAVLDELNCTEEAIQWYERSLEADPFHPDAYFKLAEAVEKQGLLDRAARHWRAYLTLDSASPKAHLARRRIRSLQAEVLEAAGPVG